MTSHVLRAAARPASSRSLPDYEAGLSSGALPDAAAGGSRLTPAVRTSGSSTQPTSLELEVHFCDGSALALLMAAVIAVAALTVILL